MHSHSSLDTPYLKPETICHSEVSGVRFQVPRHLSLVHSHTGEPRAGEKEREDSVERHCWP